jgi:hypothetical protein
MNTPTAWLRNLPAVTILYETECRFPFNILSLQSLHGKQQHRPSGITNSGVKTNLTSFRHGNASTINTIPSLLANGQDLLEALEHRGVYSVHHLIGC